MLYYLKSDFSSNNILKELKHYLNILTYKYKIKYRYIDEYLNRNYSVDLNKILNTFKKEIKIVPIENRMFQLYIDKNVYVGKNNLNNILNFLEYGNLNIKSLKIISSLMKESLKYTQISLGGF